MYPYVFLCFFECIALNHVKSLGKPSVHRLPGSIVSRCPSLCRSGCGVQLHGFQRFGDFYGVYNRVYICIYVSLQTASLIRNMMNYDVVCRQTHVAGLWTCTWMCSVFFSPRVWCNDLPTGSANHQVDLDDFTIRIMGIITVCLSPWNFLLNVSNDFFFWGEGSYSSVAKGSTNVNVVVLNLGFRTGFCTSPAFIPAYAHPQKDTNVIQSVYQVSHFSATILLLYSWMFLVYFPDFWCRRTKIIPRYCDRRG